MKKFLKMTKNTPFGPYLQHSRPVFSYPLPKGMSGCGESHLGYLVL